MALLQSWTRHARRTALLLRETLARRLSAGTPCDSDEIQRVARLFGALEAETDLSPATRRRIEDRLLGQLFDAPTARRRLSQWASALVERAGAHHPLDPGGLSADQAAEQACQALAGLTHETIESVLSITACPGGWAARVQTLEARRVPATKDIVSVYEIALDTTGQLRHAERASRGLRGAAL